MKTSFSELAERQTVRVNKINDRVSVRVRQWQNGQQTESANDVMVDGYCYTPAIGAKWLEANLPVICGIVASKPNQAHFGMGQWGN